MTRHTEMPGSSRPAASGAAPSSPSPRWLDIERDRMLREAQGESLGRMAQDFGAMNDAAERDARVARFLALALSFMAGCTVMLAVIWRLGVL